MGKVVFIKSCKLSFENFEKLNLRRDYTLPCQNNLKLYFLLRESNSLKSQQVLAYFNPAKDSILYSTWMMLVLSHSKVLWFCHGCCTDDQSVLVSLSSTTVSAVSAATSDDLKISLSDLMIVRWFLLNFEAQFLAAHFTTAILTSRQASQAMEL